MAAKVFTSRDKHSSLFQNNKFPSVGPLRQTISNLKKGETEMNLKERETEMRAKQKKSIFFFKFSPKSFEQLRDGAA